MFFKTYILEHLIVKTSSTNIYFAMDFFFKVTHSVFLYTVYIYIYMYIYIYIYILNYIYILCIIYIIYIFYIHIIYIYDKENTITTSGVDGFDAMDEWTWI